MRFALHRLVLPSVLAAALPASGATVDFERQIQPIFEAACVSCHGSEKPKGGLRMDTRENAILGGDLGTSLVPGRPEDSSLYTLTILPPDHDDIMPPKGDPLTKAQTELIRQWIVEGATWPEDRVLKAVHRVDFVKEIQPILELHCVSCHREGEAKGDLRLDNRNDAFRGGEYGPAIVAGDPEKSPLYKLTVLDADDDDLMPPAKKGGPLPRETTDLLASWIEQGAVWPEGITLVPRKPEAAPGADDLLISTEIHSRILAGSPVRDEAEMKAYKEIIPGTEVGFEMIPIPGGEFLMGSPESESGRSEDESPQHRVRIDPFWMGQCEVTWNQYELFMFPVDERRIRESRGYDASLDKTADAVTRPTSPYVEMSFGMGKDGYPAISMTQHGANKFCQWLSAKTGHFYRLPTEAEWEYACRAGTTTAYSFGDDPAKLDGHAWFAGNSDWKYQKVGTKLANPWGLHDMHGNVAEWVLDQYDPGFYALAGDVVVTNPWNRATEPYPHSVRGGSWDDDPEQIRSAARRGSDSSWKMQDPQLPKSVWYHTDAQFLGFRIVRPLNVPTPEELSKYWTSGVEKE